LQIAKPVCADVSRASNHWQRSFGVTNQTTRFGDNRQDGACCAGWPRSDPATNPKKIDAVMVLAIRNDQHVPPRYHANYLTALMGPDHVGDVDHVELEDGHHFAFIAPFADRVTREETITVALDPAGFDRAAWLDDVNQQIVAFMLR